MGLRARGLRCCQCAARAGLLTENVLLPAPGHAKTLVLACLRRQHRNNTAKMPEKHCVKGAARRAAARTNTAHDKNRRSAHARRAGGRNSGELSG